MSERSSSHLKSIEIKTGKLVIRRLSALDVEPLCSFVNRLSIEDTFVRLSGEVISIEQEKQYVADSLTLVNAAKKVHLVIEQDGEIVANAEARPNGKRQEHVGTVTIAVDQAIRNQGVGTALLKQLIEEARKTQFKILVLSSMHINKAGLAVYEKIGFIKIGVIPQAFLYRGEYVDEVIYYLPL